MEMIISGLPTSSLDVDLVMALYDLLRNIQSPWFTAQQLEFPYMYYVSTSHSCVSSNEGSTSHISFQDFHFLDCGYQNDRGSFGADTSISCSPSDLWFACWTENIWGPSRMIPCLMATLTLPCIIVSPFSPQSTHGQTDACVAARPSPASIIRCTVAHVDPRGRHRVQEHSCWQCNHWTGTGGCESITSFVQTCVCWTCCSPNTRGYVLCVVPFESATSRMVQRQQCGMGEPSEREHYSLYCWIYFARQCL